MSHYSIQSMWKILEPVEDGTDCFVDIWEEVCLSTDKSLCQSALSILFCWLRSEPHTQEL